MKANRVFKRLLKALVLTAMLFVLQACDGLPFGMEMRRVSGKQPQTDTVISEDLQFSGFGNEDGHYEDDYIP